jgi:hypothetical protein
MRHRLTGWRSALLLLLASAGQAWAAPPDFTRSEIRISPEAPRETDVVVFSIVVRNTGIDDAGSVYFMTEWPLMGFLIDTAGFEGAEVDHQARSLTLTFPLAAGAERHFEVRVLAPRDSGGDSLTLAMRASHFSSDTQHWVRETVTIDTRVSDSGVDVGGVRIAPAGVMTLAVLGGGCLLWVLLRGLTTRAASRAGRSTGSILSRHVGAGGTAAAITVALGFWTMFGAMAWRDYQSLTTWPGTTCTILGGRLSAQSTTRSRPGTSGASTDDTNYVPVLGLRYVANGREVYSSGYDTGSRLGWGGRGGRTAELDRWTVGTATTCWYNPADPTDVVVRRGFGGAYVFALLPLPVFLIGVASVRSLARRSAP